MENCCTPRCIAMKLLVAGLILVLVRNYTNWDMWIVVGALLIIKAVILFIMPNCCCNTKAKKK